MSRSDQRRRRALRAAAPVAGLLAVGLLVWQGSTAAFSATSTNNGNAWASGQVVLKNDGGTGAPYAINSTPAAFSVSGIKPGDTGQKCIVVESSGNLAASVKFYSANATSNALSTQLQLKVELDTSGAKTGCVGFTVPGSPLFNSTISALTANTTFGTGLGTWNPTGAATQYATYRFTWTLPAAATSAAMGLTAGADFIWEVQNT